MYARAAKRRGIPTATCVASWDNLTTRPRMRVLPHRLFVWNETQLQEAVELHGVPPDRVVVTGAASFDHWFGWKPRPKGEFLARIGLDPEKPVILWVGSALNPWEQPEVEFVEQWLAAVRSAVDPGLREAGILVRPHPLRLEQWLSHDLSESGNVSMWPREDMTMPTGLEQKADYYDSIFHSSAVVGINTSAMIEASIIGRPVLTVLDPAYHDSQFGALHFSYLLESSGGALRVAASLEEHLADLSSILADDGTRASETAKRFVAQFVRPHGLERPATPIVVESLEQLASIPVKPEREPLWVIVLRIVLFVIPARPTNVKRARRRLAKRSQRLTKRIRRFLRIRRFSKWRRRLSRRIRRFLLVVLPLGIRIRLRRLRQALRRAA
jgi:hypothetical protein